jgi:serine/threonine protein kinase
LEDAIIAVGNPVAYPADYVPDPTISVVNALGIPYTVPQNIIGKNLKDILCGISINLRRIVDTIGGTHGDLKYNNIMQGADSNFSLIDFGLSRSEFLVDGVNIIIECENLFNSNISESRDMTQLIWRLYIIPSIRGCSIDPILRGILTFAANPVIADPSYLPFGMDWYSRDMYGLPNHQIGPTINPTAAVLLRNVYLVLNAYENVNGAINVVGLQVCPPEAEPEAEPGHMMDIDGGSRRRNRKRRYTRKYAKKRQIIRKGRGKGQKGRRTRRASSSLY